MAVSKKKTKKRKVTKAKAKIKARKTKITKPKSKVNKAKPTRAKKAKTPKIKKKTKTKSKVKKAKTKKVAKKKVVKKKAIAKKKVSKKKVTKKKAVTKRKAKVTKKKTPKSTKKAKTVKVVPIQKKRKPRKKATTETPEVSPYASEKGEEYMSDAQLEHFREILFLWKSQLMQEVDSTVVHMKEEAISYPDPLDRAAQEEGFNLELRTRDRERKLIKKIERALDAIETGEYGYCESCGTEIGIRRLEARPTADKCIDCKTFEEIREKQAGG